jgi:hypothetical protein
LTGDVPRKPNKITQKTKTKPRKAQKGLNLFFLSFFFVLACVSLNEALIRPLKGFNNALLRPYIRLYKGRKSGLSRDIPKNAKKQTTTKKKPGELRKALILAGPSYSLIKAKTKKNKPKRRKKHRK